MIPLPVRLQECPIAGSADVEWWSCLGHHKVEIRRFEIALERRLAARVDRTRRHDDFSRRNTRFWLTCRQFSPRYVSTARKDAMGERSRRSSVRNFPRTDSPPLPVRN